jgi:hypothetical protein
MRPSTRSAALAAAATLLITSGGAAETPGPPIELDDVVSSVTVFSDQAAVTRSASIALDAGRHQVAFDLLGSGARAHTTQVDAEGAEVLAVEIVPPWPADTDSDETERAQQRRALQLEIQDLSTRYAGLHREAELLISIHRTPHRKDDELGAGLMPRTDKDPFTRWQRGRLDAMATEAEALRIRARAVRASIDVVDRLRAPETLSRERVVVTLQVAHKTTVKISQTTRVSGPHWVPDYDLHLDPEAGVGRLVINALVAQNTGEDWDGVPLTLSTAVPGAAADLPKLTAWYLEEDAPPPPAEVMDQSAMEESRSLRKDSRKRESKSRPAPSSRPAPVRKRAQKADSAGAYADFDDALDDALGDALGGLGGGGMRSEPAPDDAAPAAVASPPPPGSGGLVQRLLGPPPTGGPLIVPPRIVIPPPTGPSVDWNRYHPARQADGFDFAMQAAGRIDIPSDGVARRIPLDTLELPVTYEHRIPAVLEQTAYLHALLKQNGRIPLLSGTARVFQSGDLLGDTTLPKSARGATFEIPLGKDPQVKVERKVEEEADRSGALGGGEAITRKVTIKLRNLRADRIHAVVYDRIPVTFAKGVKVQMLDDPAPTATVNSQGKITWTVDLEPGGEATLTFRYLIRHPRNTAIVEG